MNRRKAKPAGTTKTSAIFAELRKDILGGHYVASKFPSERLLMRRFGVSRMLVRNVLSQLKSDGLLAARQGKGTFVPPHAKRMSERLGFIIPGIGREEFFSPICTMLVSHAQRKGFTPVFADLAAPSPRGRYRMVELAVQEFIDQKVSAVAYQPLDFLSDSPTKNAELLERFRCADVPVILFDYDIVPRPDRSQFDLVCADNLNAGWVLGRHLIERGAARIAFLMRDNWAFSVFDRRAGLELAAREGGRPFAVTHVEPSDAAGVAALLRRRDAPDAIVCGNDLLAASLLKTLQSLDVRVPEEVMVAGFDDSPAASSAEPSLTTMHLPTNALATSLFEVMMIRMRNPTLPFAEMTHHAWLVPRVSTAR